MAKRMPPKTGNSESLQHENATDELYSFERIEQSLNEQEAKSEITKVYRLAYWPDEKRAMPTDFLTSALFAAIHTKDAKFYENIELASVNGYIIRFRGKRLTQVHADVWQGIMHLARGQQEGSRLKFRARTFLRMIGRKTGKSQRKELGNIFDELCATCVTIIDTKNKQRFWGSLLPSGASRDEDDDTLFSLEINRDLARIFDFGHTRIDWQLRAKLKAKPLQLWLQLYFTHTTKPVAVSELHRLSGSAATLKKFRQNLRVALVELASAGGHAAIIDNETDTVRAYNSLPISAIPVQAEPAVSPSAVNSPTTGLLVVSEKALEQARKRYHEHDMDQCLADWLKWKGSQTAVNPDAAFCGFAKVWVTTKRSDG